MLERRDKRDGRASSLAGLRLKNEGTKKPSLALRPSNNMCHFSPASRTNFGPDFLKRLRRTAS
jgi:hypothetical protein